MNNVTSKIRNKEYVEIITKYDRTIINTVIIELVDNNYHYGLIFCYGNACAASPYDANGMWLCVRWGFPALKPIDITNFNLSTNDYR
jgi:hypothetical protein